MTQATDRDHERLARQVRARRLELGLSLAALADRAGLSKGTCQRAEEGRPIRDVNYAKLDAALGWAPGSCAAIRDGGHAEPAIEGEKVVTHKVPITEDGVGDAFMIIAVKNTELPADRIRAMKDELIEELRQRGLL